MKIQEQSFSGKIFRPKPKYYISNNKKLITVITPWGQEAVNTQDVFESISSQYHLLSEDKESTHPFPKLMSLTAIQNDMRTTVIQINQNLFNNINQDEYAMGFELFFATIVENIFTFIQIGPPMILIDRPRQCLHSIGQVTAPSLNAVNSKYESALFYNIEQATNPSLNVPANTQAPPPLPYQLMGIYQDISFHPFSFRFQSEDRLILLNRDTIPGKWFELTKEERTLEKLSRQAAEDNPHNPFWLAILQLNSDS